VEEWGLVINGLSAAGSLGAALVALWLARKSDRDRQRDREDAAFAQARLVLVEVIDHPHAPELFAVVRNHSREPILDVTLSSVLYMPLSMARFQTLRPEGGYVPVLLPGQSQKFSFTHLGPDDDENMWGHLDPPQMLKEIEDYYAVVRFTDAADTYWQYSWSVDDVTLTRLARDYQPRDITIKETDRGVRIRRRQMNFVADDGNNPFSRLGARRAPWHHRTLAKLRRVGRRPPRPGSSPFDAPPPSIIERKRRE
jgi:hypothetical protein